MKGARGNNRLKPHHDNPHFNNFWQLSEDTGLLSDVSMKKEENNLLLHVKVIYQSMQDCSNATEETEGKW